MLDPRLAKLVQRVETMEAIEPVCLDINSTETVGPEPIMRCRGAENGL